MVDLSKLTQYNWWGNENEPPKHFKTKTQVSKSGMKPLEPVAFVEGKTKTIYLYDPTDPLSARPKGKKNPKNPILIQDQSQPSQSNSAKHPSLPPADSNSSQTESTSFSDNLELLQKKKAEASLKQFLNSLIFILLFFSGNLALMTSSCAYFLWASRRAKQIPKMGRKYSFAIRQEAEARICNLIRKKFTRPGMKLYSIHDNNYAPQEASRRAEIILHLPPDRVFLIDVNSLVSLKGDPVKVYYDPNLDVLKYNKGKSRNQKIEIDYIQSLTERANWLVEHEPDLVPRNPIKIIVFANSPSTNKVEMYHHENTPVQTYGRNSFMFHKGVYVVEEKSLINLIMRLTPKPETKSQK